MLALITATFNSAKTLPDAIQSAQGLRQDVQHIFVDGGSSDDTLNQIESFVSTSANARLLHQTTKGLYEALNQGVLAAIEDTRVSRIGLLHSDDVLRTDTFSEYLSHVKASGADVCYSNVDFHNAAGQRVRRWYAGHYSHFKLRTGWMPPHTSLIVRKQVYETIGLYNPDFGTAADYEWVVRVFSAPKLRFQFIPLTTVSMLVGGASSASLKARLIANANDGRVWAEHSRLQAGVIRICKPLRKLGQFL